MTGALTWEAAEIIGGSYAFENRPNQNVIREILGILEHDGYITRDSEGHYRFVSRLVRDWWRARFGSGFVPVSRRGS